MKGGHGVGERAGFKGGWMSRIDEQARKKVCYCD